MTSGDRALPRGFTLVEVLVALAILSVSLVALLSVFGDNLQRAVHIRDNAMAISLAQSLLATTASGRPLRAGDTAGDFADGFRWRKHIAPYGDASDAASWPLRAFQVRVEVLWTEGRIEHAATLDTLRLARKDAVP
jgi:general secretion pathway protein I